MRQQLCDALVKRAALPQMMFLTGDLGFMALEPLSAALGSRFINAGVAEQNMVSVAAAMAREGLDVWVYSIAPFCYARPFEQIRNDVAFHELPVRLIGNGGGYGYGVMGPTHHAIEDYGVLLTLPGMRVYVPVFDQDIAAVIDRAGATDQPAYIRLGRGEAPPGFDPPEYAGWRKLIDGEGPPVIAVGPLAGTYIKGVSSLPPATRPSLWAISELPLASNPPPNELIGRIASQARVFVAEEHVEQGGFASNLAMYMLQHGIFAQMVHLHAQAHQYTKYGSQAYLRSQSGLDPDSLLRALSLG